MQSFVDAIRNKPSDPSNYLVFADWLEENGFTPEEASLVRSLSDSIRRIKLIRSGKLKNIAKKIPGFGWAIGSIDAESVLAILQTSKIRAVEWDEAFSSDDGSIIYVRGTIRYDEALDFTLQVTKILSVTQATLHQANHRGAYYLENDIKRESERAFQEFAIKRLRLIRVY